MQSIHPETPQGINPGAGFRMPGPLGMCGRQDARRGRGHPRTPFDPQACDHRHHFRRWGSVRKDRGFDDGSPRRSQWQLIPAGGTREVDLLFDRLFAKQVFSEHPDIASVHPQHDRYVIAGLRAGSTGLHAANARGICWSELEITVRQPKQIPVVFHYVEDERNKTSRSVGSGGSLLARVNEIIAPQTCISFGEQVIDTPVFRIGADLGDFVDPRAGDVKLLFKERVSKLQTFGAINVFFVWRVAAMASETTGGEMLDNAMCFFGDNTKKDAGRMLAHEFGHYLTRFHREVLYDAGGHTADEECLMEQTASGTRIRRKEADAMYRTAADSGAK